jgi:hypothetical protein
MQGKADVFFMGAIGGVLTVDLTLQDGQQWHFDGGFGSLGTPVAGAMGDELVADFPGLDHIEGGCAFHVEAAGFTGGACIIEFFDLHKNPTIGTVTGSTYGGSMIVGFGGGTWSNARHRPAAERARAAIGTQIG